MQELSSQSVPLGPDQLSELALDLRWTWSHEADQLWNAIDPGVWEKTKTPWLLLQVVSQSELLKLLQNKVVVGELQYLLESRKEYRENPGWFRQNYTEKTLNPVAYFSMEFGLGEALLLYAGGVRYTGWRLSQDSKRLMCAYGRYRLALPGRLFSATG